MYHHLFMATLKLTLSKSPFAVMVTGEKQTEYRRASKWIESRLYDKNQVQRHYDFVEFTNGYGADKPWFRARYMGTTVSDTVNVTFSNGLRVNTTEKTYCIQLGEVVEKRFC
jgi:hypothetical protein